MVKKEIKVSISKNGKVELDVQNAQGSECEEWTQELEKALGGNFSREHKPSYFESGTSDELTEQDS